MGSGMKQVLDSRKNAIPSIIELKTKCNAHSISTAGLWTQLL